MDRGSAAPRGSRAAAPQAVHITISDMDRRSISLRAPAQRGSAWDREDQARRGRTGRGPGEARGQGSSGARGRMGFEMRMQNTVRPHSICGTHSPEDEWPRPQWRNVCRDRPAFIEPMEAEEVRVESSRGPAKAKSCRRAQGSSPRKHCAWAQDRKHCSWVHDWQRNNLLNQKSSKHRSNWV